MGGGVLWTLGYVVLVAAPLVVLASGLVAPRGSGWWFDFSLALGFGALGLMGGQFLLTARFRRASAPFGMDVLYVLHRWVAVVALLLVAGHYVVLRTRYPAALDPAWPWEAPLYMSAGRAALLVFAVLVASSLWRRALGIEYDRWRIGHAVLAVAGMALSLVHVLGVRYYSEVFWTRVVLDLFLGSLVALVAYVRVVKPLLLTGKPYRVAEVRPERGRSWTLTLEPDGHTGFAFQPGQFGWLSLGRSPLHAGEHPFSFSGSGEAPGSLRMTIKELGDFTSRIGRTPVGTTAYVDGPYGVFTVDRYPAAPGFFFLAGGVGIAPIMSMLRALADRGDERPLRLVYGSRSWEAATFREELEALSARLDLEVTHVLEEPHPGWEGAVGRPDREIIRRAVETLPSGIHCFLCGPTAMSDMSQEALRARGIPTWRIHFEIFEMA